MNELIRRAIRNTPAMNTLMFSLIFLGIFCLFNMRREVFPEFELEILLVNVIYPGASPDEVEEGICQKIEEAVRSIEGIKKQTSIAKEGSGSIVLELNVGVDAQRILGEVRSEVDRIPSFPLLAEDPEVEQITLRQPAISVGVVGPRKSHSHSELELREITEQVRDELLMLPAVSQATIAGAKEYQIDVEIPEETLRRYGLTLQDVARKIRRENLELPGGTIRTESQDILVKGKKKGSVGHEIETIPLITQPNGTVLTVRDLGRVRDEFADIESSTYIDGLPGMAISVERTSSEDLLAMTDAVHEYVRTKILPPGYKLVTWSDRSVEVRDRLRLLSVNGVQGLVLVLIMLALFLNLRLASWVAVGIPFSILGACALLYFSGHTLNMLTTFTFVMALGIVVDDAIVIGENIHAHRLMGKGPLQAAIDGTMEVAASVTASVATTVIAFLPLMFVSGVMGKFIAVMPVAMISILVFSLLEGLFILPCHLAHESEPGETGPWKTAFRLYKRMPRLLRWTVGPLLLGVAFILDQFVYPIRRLNSFVDLLNRGTNYAVEFVAARLYLPMLRGSLHRPSVALSAAMALLLIALGLIRGGIVPFIIFPKNDSNTIQANVTFPDGTPVIVTDKATKQLEEAIFQVNEKYRELGEPVLRLTRRSVGYLTMQQGAGPQMTSSGGHIGGLTAELEDTSIRTIESQKILNDWRKVAGEFPGAESVTFGAFDHGPGGTPIEFKLLARREDMDDLEGAVDATKQRLQEFPGVFDIADDSSPGKWEFQLKVKENAVAMGVPLQELAETVRASYFGEEVMRLQRGRHEVKLMVRYPREDRRSLAKFDDIRVRAGDYAERPLSELADVKIDRGYSEINRVNQLRSITISADVDESQANAREIVSALQTQFMPQLFKQYPNISVRWEGQQEQTNESVRSLIIGLAIALLAMFALLTFEFTSYFQPLLIMAIIPFGIVGAVFGHAILGMPLTLFSLFGLVTLTGVVVNDSIVLIDFINHRVRNGEPLQTAILDAGSRRMRPIFLTSVTTVAGLLPLLFETSFQAQILIPMAVSICFGLTLSTLLVLIIVPTLYQIHATMTGAFEVTPVDGTLSESDENHDPVLTASRPLDEPVHADVS
ncbi:MAG: efflux RND transporter permease subunit [Planctomycetota bacterium]|nr:efflux RND transporter permease subunit [Planctomycetota bacterium]MDA1210872.1 efflux RND transporter permease subunit [Planctomycetota bacterium]